MRLPPSSLALAVLLCACGSSGPTLGSAEHKMAFLFPATDEATNQVNGFELDLQYDWGFTGGCMVLSDQAQATVNGVPVDTLFRGGEDRFGSFGRECQPPSFRFPVSAAEVDELTLVLEDGADRFEAVALNVGRPLGMTLAPPADGHIRAGSRVGLTWTPGTDDLSQMWGTFDTTGGFPHTVGDFDQGLLIPGNAAPGPATLSVEIRHVGVSRCEGAELCDFSYSLSPGDRVPAPFRAVAVTFQVEP